MPLPNPFFAQYLEKVKEERAGKTSPKWSDVLGGGAGAAIGGLTQAVGGLTESAGNLYQYTPGALVSELLGGVNPETLERLKTGGRKIAETGQFITEATAPEMGDMWYADPKKMVYGATANVGQMLPALGLSAVNPAAGLSAIGATSYGQAYSNAKQKGLDEKSAQLVGLGYGATEVITERIPLNTLFKKWGDEPFKNAIKFMAQEAGQEISAEAIQSGIDKLSTDKGMTLQDFGVRMRDMLVQLPLSTVGTMAAGKGLQAAVSEKPEAIAYTPYKEMHRRESVKELQRMGVPRGTAEIVADSPRFSVPVDATTGLYEGRREGDTEKAIDSAIGYVKDTGGDAFWVSADIANLSGMNAFFGNVAAEANQRYRGFADIVKDELGKVGHVDGLRTGGDEFGALVVGADESLVAKALDSVRMRATEYAKQQGLHEIPHPKYPGDLSKRGVNLHMGYTSIETSDSAKDVMRKADIHMDTSKGAKDVTGGQAAAGDQVVRDERPEGDRQKGQRAIVQERRGEKSPQVRALGDFVTSSAPSKNMTTMGVERAIADTAKKWGDNAPKVVVVQSESELPPNILQQMGQLKQGDLVTKGVRDASTRSIFMVADNISSKGDALTVLAHEAVGHHSMEEMLGDQFSELVGQIQDLKGKNKQIASLSNDVQSLYGSLSPENEAREIIAMMAEKRQARNLLGDAYVKVRQAIRKFLRKLGIHNEFSDDDIEALLSMAGKHLKESGGQQQGGDIAFSRAAKAPQEQQQDPALKTASQMGVSPQELAEAAKRGIQTNKATEELANILGINQTEIDKFMRRNLGTSFNAEELHQAADMMNKAWSDSQRELAYFSEKVEAGDMSDKDWVRVEEVFHTLNTMQAQFMGVRGEAGRALQIFNKIRETTKVAEAVQLITEAHGGRDMLAKKLQAIASLDKPGAGYQAIRNEMSVTKWDKFIEWYVNSLVSGVPTHVVNVTSNFLVSALEDINRVVAAGIGTLHGGEKVTFNEALAHIMGSFTGSLHGMKAFAQAIKDENSPLQFRGKYDQVHKQAIKGLKGKVIRVPTRMLGAEDAFFKTLAMTKELHALAVRRSLRTGENVGSLINSPPKELSDEAWDSGFERTFTNRPGPIAQALLGIRRAHPLANLIFPFVNTPANIVNYGLKHTPAAFAYKQVKEDMKAGGAKRDQALARVVTGSSIGMAVMALAAQGLISGSPPEDPNKRRLWYAAGNQPYSLKIGDTWYSYSRLEPIGMLFGVSADMYRLSNVMGTDDAENIAALVIGSVSNNLLSKTYLRGLSDAVNAVTDPERYGERWVKSLAAGITTPVFLSYTAKAVDPTLREAETIIDQLKSRVPGMSKTLEPRLDVFGRERVSEGSSAYRFFSPAWQRKDTKDPVANELLRLDVSVPQVGKKVMGVELSTAQRNELKKALGQNVYNAVQRVMEAPNYKNMPDAAKAYVLDKTVSGVRRYGQLHWKMQHPEIMREAAKIKVEEAMR